MEHVLRKENMTYFLLKAARCVRFCSSSSSLALALTRTVTRRFKQEMAMEENSRKRPRGEDFLEHEYPNDLAERIKNLEAFYDQTLPARSPFVVRLDGVAFHTFTQGMQKPFDERIKTALVETSKDILRRFNPVLVYHQSDEITVVFRAAIEPEEDSSASGTTSSTDSKKKRNLDVTHPYSGRVQKIASTLASYAGARFNFHLNKFDWSDLPQKNRDRVQECSAYFDARAFETPTEKLAMESVYWRHKADCFRNAISAIGQSKYNHSRLQGVSTKQKINMLRADFGIDLFKDYPARHLYGTFIKMEQVTIDAVNPKTGQAVQALRSRVCTGSFPWVGTEEEMIRFTLARFWPENGPPKDVPVPSESTTTMTTSAAATAATSTTIDAPSS